MDPQDEPMEQAGEDGAREIARLTDEILPVLIARLGASGLGELEVRQDGWRVRLRRGPNGVNGAQPGGAAAAPAGRGPDRHAATDPSGHGELAGRGEAAGRGESSARRERGRLKVTSPAVGFYQPRDSLAVGMSVRGGDLLGHVEVLGVRQDVVAPEDGIIAALVAQPGEAVEYGQPLLRIEPEGRG